MIKCGECGYENMDGLDYCDGCGAKLAAGAPAGWLQPPRLLKRLPAAAPAETRCAGARDRPERRSARRRNAQVGSADR